MRRKHTITLEVTVLGPRERFDPAKASEYYHDAEAQRNVADELVNKLGLSFDAVANVDTELTLVPEEKVIQKAYHEEEDRKYHARENALEAIGDEIGIERAIFSMSEVAPEDMHNVIDEGIVTLQADADSFWGGEKGENFIKPIKDLTYAKLWKAFDESIVVTGDQHHVFLEGYKIHKHGRRTVVTFITGS